MQQKKEKNKRFPSNEVATLKARARELGITYPVLAERSGVPLQTLQKIFCGLTQHPRIDTMQAIEEALGLSSKPLEWTDAEKAEGVITQYAERLSPDETELIDLYRAVKSEKGDRGANAIKMIIQTYLDRK